MVLFSHRAETAGPYGMLRMFCVNSFETCCLHMMITEQPLDSMFFFTQSSKVDRRTCCQCHSTNLFKYFICRFGSGNPEGYASYWTGASFIDKACAGSRQGNSASAKNSCTGKANSTTTRTIDADILIVVVIGALRFCLYFSSMWRHRETAVCWNFYAIVMHKVPAWGAHDRSLRAAPCCHHWHAAVI